MDMYHEAQQQAVPQAPAWPTNFAREIANRCEEELLRELQRMGAPERAYELLRGMAYFSLYQLDPNDALVAADFAESLQEALGVLG